MHISATRALLLTLCFAAGAFFACGKKAEAEHHYQMSELEAMAPRQLLHAMRVDPYHTREIAGLLKKAGESDKAVKELYGLLRTRDHSLGVRMAIKELGAPLLYDRETNKPSTFNPPGEETDILECSAEVDGDVLLASWDINFGQRLFFRPPEDPKAPVTFPLFAKQVVEVSGGALKEPVKKEYDGAAGHNIHKNEKILSGLVPGAYRVSVGIVTQYVNTAGTHQSMNTSCSLEVEK